MKCQKCIKEGKKSTILMPMYGTTTLMAYSPGYYDEDGNYQPSVNPNTTTYQYSCSNGHSWVDTK
jgi:hypothetical protein